MKPWLLMVFLVVLTGAVQAEGAKPAKGIYHGAQATEYPAWFKQSFLDLREDIAEASAAKRHVLLLFTQDNCPYCNRLIEHNLAQRDIESALRSQFDVIALNMWGDRVVTGLDGKTRSEKDFAASLKVQFTPTLLFFDASGQVVLRLNGYVPPGRFKAALDWVSGPMTQPFRDYMASLEGSQEGGELITEPYFKPLTDLRRPASKSRPLAVFFEQKDCAECATLHRRVLRDAMVQEAMIGFDSVQFDLWSTAPIITPDGRSLRIRDWTRELDVKYAPSIVLFDAEGQEIIRWEASFRVFHTAGMFAYVGSTACRTEPSFQRFLSARGERIRESGRDVNIWRYADEPN